jgi:hypothetical protein
MFIMRSLNHGLRLAVIASAVALTAGAAAAQPVVHVEPEVLDFGRMKQQESRTGEVTISNRGDAPLEIRDVKTTCGCTAAVPDVSVLQPGESTALRIDFNSKRFQGDQQKAVRIMTNDPQRPEARAYVAAYVHVPLITNPDKPRIFFSQVRQGTSATEVFEFTAADEEVLEVELARHDPDLFELSVVNRYEDDPKRSALMITVPENMPAGDHRDIVRVATNVPDAPTMDIDVRARVVLDLKAFPDRVNFRYVKAGQTLTKNVRVSAVDRDTEFAVTGADVDIPGLKASVEETVPAKEFFVYLRGNVLPDSDQRLIDARGRLQGTLRIETSLASQPVIEVPVVYLVRL